jgi:hypothetical protein
MAFTINPPRTMLTDRSGNITPEWYRFFAQIQRILGNDILQSLQEAPYIVYAPDPVLTGARTAAEGAGIVITIGDLSATFSLAPSEVMPGTYGSETELSQVTVDQYGRVTDADAIQLVSDNVAEGMVNLYFTTERARQSISGADGIAYDPATGVASVDDTVVRTTGAQTLSGKTLASPEITGPLTVGGVTAITSTGIHQLRSYTVATVPSASPAGQMIYVTNASGGAIPAFSDGTSWRRVTDRSVIN